MEYKTRNEMVVKVVEDNPKIIIQIVHGAMEHIHRYDEFISDLNKNGVSVVTRSLYGSDMDLLVNEKTKEFYHSFDKKDIVKSILEVSKYIQENYPSAKHILLGHSMGSFISKKAYFENMFKYDGLILVGTNFNPNYKKNLGSMLLLPVSYKKVSKFGNWVVFGQNDFSSKVFKRQSNWISTDKDHYKDYQNDLLTGNNFSGSSLKALMSLLNDNSKKKNYQDFKRKNSPILLIAGSNDPVSNYGKQIKKFHGFLIENYFTNVSSFLYPKSRHEVLMDVEKDKVLNDILEWIKANF